MATDKATQLNKLYFDQSYRLITKPTRLEEYLKDVEGLKTLSPGQQAKLTEIKSKFDSDKQAVLLKEAKAWRDFEMEWKPDSLAEALGEPPRRPQPPAVQRCMAHGKQSTHPNPKKAARTRPGSPQVARRPAQ